MLALSMLFCNPYICFCIVGCDFRFSYYQTIIAIATCCRSFALILLGAVNCYVFQVGSCDVKFPIRLEGLVLTHSQAAPQLFILYLAFICSSRTEIH
jgi:hypothetical protein